MDTSIQNHLLPNEKLLWEGRPQVSTGFDLSNLGKSMFGVMWLGFSLFWTVSAFLMTRFIESSDPTGIFFKIFFPLFGLPFIIIGVFIVFVSPRKQKAKDLQTFYYVTNKRIIINILASSPTFTSTFINELNSMQITKNRDNMSNIMFDSLYNVKNNNSLRALSAPTVPASNNCFYRIENADEVHKLILMQQEIINLETDN